MIVIGFHYGHGLNGDPTFLEHSPRVSLKEKLERCSHFLVLPTRIILGKINTGRSVLSMKPTKILQVPHNLDV